MKITTAASTVLVQTGLDLLKGSINDGKKQKATRPFSEDFAQNLH